MGVYDQERSSALADITAAGLPIILRQSKSPSTFGDATAPWEGRASTVVTQTTVGLFTSIRNTDFARVVASDRAILVPGLGLTTDPDTNMTLEADSVVYRVIDMKLISPNGERILWKLQVRA